MAASQIMEVVGPQKDLIRKMIAEYGLEPKSASALEKELIEYFPNKEKKSRSALGGYYYLLSVLENHGLEKKLIHYDFIKGIYQLEPYEELLGGQRHDSPKDEFAKEVEAQAKQIGRNLDPTALEKIGFALRHPGSAIAAKENVNIYEGGKAHVRDLAEFLRLSQNGRTYLIEAYDPQLKNAEEFVLWLARVMHDESSPVDVKDRKSIEQWLNVSELERINYQN